MTSVRVTSPMFRWRRRTHIRMFPATGRSGLLGKCSLFERGTPCLAHSYHRLAGAVSGKEGHKRVDRSLPSCQGADIDTCPKGDRLAWREGYHRHESCLFYRKVTREVDISERSLVDRLKAMQASPMSTFRVMAPGYWLLACPSGELNMNPGL